MNNTIKKPMTRSEIISEVASLTGNVDKTAIKNIITNYENVLLKDLINNHETKVGPIGKIKIKERKARNGINPSTGEKVVIPAKIMPKFTFSKSLKDYISEKIKM